jgi:hypothetical protein
MKITTQKIQAPIKAPFTSTSLFCERYFRPINMTKYVKDAAEAVKNGFVFPIFADY